MASIFRSPIICRLNSSMTIISTCSQQVRLCLAEKGIRRQTRKSLARIPRHKSLAEKGAKFKSLHDSWRDTSTPQGELLVTILAGFATFERHLIKARTDDGRKRAKARGVRFGRPRKLDQHQRREALQRLANGETLVDAARTFGVDPTTIGRLQSSFVLRGAAALTRP